MPRRTNPAHRKHHKGLGRPPFEQIALLLQNMRFSEGVVEVWNPKVFVADAPVD